MLSVVRKRTLSNTSNIDFEKLDDVVMGEIAVKPDVPKVQVTPPKETRIGK